MAQRAIVQAGCKGLCHIIVQILKIFTDSTCLAAHSEKGMAFAQNSCNTAGSVAGFRQCCPERF